MNTTRINATTTQRRMTEPELANAIELAGRSWTYAIIATFRTFGIELTDPDGPSINPAHYQIPAEQWNAIAEACAPTDADRLARVNHMLDWMNYGPGGYEPAEATR